MRLLDRLRPFFLLLATLPALVLVDAVGPLDWRGGFILILYGSWIAEIDRRLNPQAQVRDKGPLLPWNQMDAGDRLEYFFLPLSITVVGALIVGITISASVGSEISWLPLAFGSLAIACGSALAFANWRDRWGTVDAD